MQIALLTLPWLFPFATGPQAGVQPWLFALACFGVFLGLGAWRSREAGWAEPLAQSVLLAALLSTVIAAIQYFGLEKPFAPWLASSFKGEAFSNLRQKNQFATLAVMGFWALVFVVLSRPKLRAQAWAPAVLLAAAFLGLGNAVAASRTGVAELAFTVVAMALWGWRSGQARWVALLVAANVLGFLVATFGLPLLHAGGASVAERAAVGAEGCHSRLLLWQNVWQLALERPLTGWGWGSMKEAHYLGVFDNRFCEILDNAHNLPLHLAMELGLVAAGAFVLGTLWLLWRTWPATLARDHGFGAAHMACGMLGMVLLHSMLEYPLWYGPFQIASVLCIGVLWCNRSGASANTKASAFSWPPLAIGVFCVAASAYASFDYWRVSQIYTDPGDRHPAYRDNTLEKIRGSQLFAHQVEFADLSIVPITAANAAERLPLALRMLRHSPEPRVIEAVIQAATFTGRADLVKLHTARYQAAFPSEFAQWRKTSGSQAAQ
jgi:O-antigen ligase